ncbi:MAG: tRNA guanosine(34) transglycosylase Tgt [Planctomycetes bacterium]|nr:tRNA guanosine(34) transglycosylase Tgt [Planctomycetota bacterium]
MPTHFELLRSSAPDAPRRGRLVTEHGTFQTPGFAPCATAGSVKGLLPEQVTASGTELILGNTYHLALRPGADLVRDAGGLHRFMGWKGPILTDSGGYQVFSLAGKRAITNDGVSFAGPDSGQELFLSPLTALEIQRDLGSDIAMVLDECPPHACSRQQLERAHSRTLSWARTARTIHRDWGGIDRGQALFGIVQGGGERELREQSCDELVALDFDGYAIGGASVGEPKPEMHATIGWCTPRLPEDRIRYLMGVGDPDDLVLAVCRGVDIFDCVAPTRHGRNNRVWVPQGTLNLKNAQHRESFVPLQAGCACPACSNFTRAYIRHLAVAKEMLGGILQSLHNLWFLQSLMRGLRERIETGSTRDDLLAWFRADYPGWSTDRAT